MINRILVCLDKSPYSDSSVDFACWLAKHHDASIEGMVVIDTPGIERSFGGGGIGRLVMRRIRGRQLFFISGTGSVLFGSASV